MASLVAVLVCNPITFPAMAFASYRLGTIILDGAAASGSAEVAAKGGIAAIRENLIALVTKAEFDLDAVVEVFGTSSFPTSREVFCLGRRRARSSDGFHTD